MDGLCMLRIIVLSYDTELKSAINAINAYESMVGFIY